MIAASWWLIFALPSGATSRLGMQLADEISKALAGLPAAPHVIDRSTLRTYLGTEKIPSNLLDTDNAARWLGQQLGATAVLRGKTETVDEKLRTEVQLLACDKEKAAPREELTLPSGATTGRLEPIEAFPKGGRISSPETPPGIFKTGNQVTNPTCRYCPPPSYSEPARQEKIKGFILLKVIVNAEGAAESVTILRGQPFGLNEAAANTVKQQWRFNPGTKDGQLVPVQVQIEVDFRLY